MTVFLKDKDKQIEMDFAYAKHNGELKEIVGIYAKHNGELRTIWQAEWVYVIPEDTTLTDLTLSDLFDNPLRVGTYTVINNGIIGCDTLDQGLLVDGFHERAVINLINYGYIVGKGGTGGYDQSGVAGSVAATDGTTAIKLQQTCGIRNLGTIGGGGGGGTGCRGTYIAAIGPAYGGGGAGHVVGQPIVIRNGSTAGTLTTGGVGETYNFYAAAQVHGGDGGALGKDATLGSGWSPVQGYQGKAGKAIDNTSGTTSTLVNEGEYAAVLGVNDLDTE